MDVIFRNTSESDLRKELNQKMTNAVLPVTIFIGVEMVLGFFGNILILLVYSRRYRRTNFRYFVLSMATVDFISCITTLPGEIFAQLNWYNYRYGWICKAKSYFNIFTVWGSASILLILAFDRYRKICHPLRWQIQTALALKLCSCSLILSAFVSVPVTILWGKHEYNYDYDGNNITVSVCEKSSRYADSVYPLIFIGSVYFLPVGSMIFIAGSLNFMTARKVFGHNVQKAVSLSSAASPTTVASSAASLEIVTLSTAPSISVPSRLQESNTTSSNYDLAEKQTDVCFLGQTNNICATQDTSRARHLEASRRQLLKTVVYQKRKIIIVLVLTSVFIITMKVYVVLTSLVAKPDGILDKMSNSTKVLFFFFWRLYFINCVVNPILYGFMDPRFRTGLLSYLRKTASYTRAFNWSHSSH